jgi:hypothetical protein
MLSKINKWFIALPESAQSYFLNLLILNLSVLDVIPDEFKTKEKKAKFLKGYLDGVGLTTSEELKRFLLGYSTIDIIIQAKRDYDFEAEQIRTFKKLNLADEVPNSKHKPMLEYSASGAEEEMWREVILSWDSFKKDEKISLMNIAELILK